mgnify:CR=1 FL=1
MRFLSSFLITAALRPRLALTLVVVDVGAFDTPLNEFLARPIILDLKGLISRVRDVCVCGWVNELIRRTHPLIILLVV